GNTALSGGVWIILIIIMGNIINVTMENSIFSGVMITVAEKRYSFFIANGFYSSLLFGLWHSIMPLRNFIDGEQSLTGAVLSALLLFGSSFLFSVQLGMQFKQANSSLWDGMTVHFINNASVNLIHVVLADGTDSNPTMRIAIAQTIMFIIVAVRWYLWQYDCNNPSCSHKTCYAEYRYNGCKPDVKKAIIKWATDGAGIRATANPHRNGRNVELLSR
ncbi:MAG: CPBP family intramembrane metalloprotease, partial [Treponema sp.]|nr:CPBP family intramembrane metalloprotease [Treponema sp.]